MKVITSICVILVVLALGDGASLLTDNSEEAAQKSGYRYGDGARPPPPHEEEVQTGDMQANAVDFAVFVGETNYENCMTV